MAAAAKDLVALLWGLMQLELQTIELYRELVDLTPPSPERRRLLELIEAHRRHVLLDGELPAEVVRDASAGLLPPPAGPLDPRVERPLLEALVEAEEVTASASESALSTPRVPLGLRRVLARILVDQQRHSSWLLTRIDACRAQPAPACGT